MPTNPEHTTRGLYSVIVVDPDTEEITLDFYTIAQNHEDAKIKVLLEAKFDGELDNVDIIVNRLGDVRSKTK